MVDFTREEVKTALEEYASTLAEEEEDESSVLPPSMEKFLKELGDKMGDI